MHHRLVGLPSDDDPQQRLQRGGGHAHGRRGRDGPHRVSDGPVLDGGRCILAEPCGAAHPHIDHHRVIVPRDGAGERVRLRAAKPVEALDHAAVGGGDVGAQPLRRDALRVLQRLRLIVRPSDAGRECGDNGRGDLHRPLGADARERVSERVGVVVPRVGGEQVGLGGAGQQADEVGEREGPDGFVAGGGGHERSIRDGQADGGPRRRNSEIKISCRD